MDTREEIHRKRMMRLQVGSLESGPELDRMLAEQVMGWRYIGVVQRTPGQGGPIDAFDDGRGGSGRWFTPSSDIACAWLLLEQMAGTHYDAHVGKAQASAAYNVPFYECELTDAGGLMRARAHADTAPLAISRCALMAVNR